MLFAVSSGYAQFKGQQPQNLNLGSAIFTEKPSNMIFSFLNSKNFSMQQSVGMSYSTFSGQSLAIGSYTNSMMYKFSDRLNVQLDATVLSTPYSSLGKDFSNSLNGVYLSRAQINYQPWDNVNVMIRYSRVPQPYGYGYWTDRSGFSDLLMDDFAR